MRNPATWIGLGPAGGLLAGCALLAPLPKSVGLTERLSAFPTRDLPLDGPVTVYWNDRHIPFVEAESDGDAAFALGLVHAHLRLGQMTMARLIAYGRLSEAVGPLAVDIDKGLRILSFSRAAAASERAGAPGRAPPHGRPRPRRADVRAHPRLCAGGRTRVPPGDAVARRPDRRGRGGADGGRRRGAPRRGLGESRALRTCRARRPAPIVQGDPESRPQRAGGDAGWRRRALHCGGARRRDGDRRGGHGARHSRARAPRCFGPSPARRAPAAPVSASPSRARTCAFTAATSP